MRDKDIILLVLVVCAFLLGMVGLHNIDLAFNFSRLPNSESLVDCNILHCVSIEDMYIRAITAVEVSFALNLIIVIILLLERGKHD